MKALATVLLFGLSSLPLFAQVSDKYRRCDEDAKSQFEMNACASEEAARDDAELNREYRKLLSIAEKDHERTAKIKSMEKAWIAFRDAYLEAMYPAKDKQAEYGSIFPMEADLLRAKLTQQQIAALREMQTQGSEP
jgi:uncharacterized protein YecT (DUF1311 family)